MTKDRTSGLVTFARYILLTVGIGYIVIYLLIVVYRIDYPFELEWMEGGAVDHIRWILSGNGLYVPPSLEFVPYIYTPLYFYLSAGFSAVMGIGFLPLRLISVASSLGSLGLIFLLVRRETQNTTGAVIAASLFAATFRLSGAWFDIARIDSLFLFLLLAGVYTLRFTASSRAWGLAGLLISLSFMTKQVAVLIALPLMLYAFIENRRLSLYFIAAVITVVGAGTLVLDRIHDGWFLYYIYKLPKGHEIVSDQFAGFWLKDLLLPLPVACIMAGYFIYGRIRDASKRKSLFYPPLAAGMLGGAWFSRLHLGGYDNVLMPAHALIAILMGLALSRILRTIRNAYMPLRSLSALVLMVCCLVQFWLVRYDPIAQIPTKDDELAGREIVGMLSKIEGEVLMPDHGFLPHLAGKRTYAHRMALHDVFRGDDGGAKADLIAEIATAAHDRRFSAIILDSYWRRQEIEPYYEPHGPIFTDPGPFWPVTGKRTRPTYLLTPR